MVDFVSRRITCDNLNISKLATQHEWLVTNGLGGFSSGTLSGGVSRRHHGLLVAALPAPLGRAVMLNRLQEKINIDSESIPLNEQEFTDNPPDYNCLHLKEFRLDMGLPVWVYQINNVILEKRILFQHLHNTIFINYTITKASSSIELELRPAVHFRPIESSVDLDIVNIDEYTLTTKENIYKIEGGKFPPLLIQIIGNDHSFNIDNHRWDNIYFRLEKERGYPSIGKHWSPGFFKIVLNEGESTTIIATVEKEDEIQQSFEDVLSAEIKRRNTLLSIAKNHLNSNETAELVLAADQFIITPAGRAEEIQRARAVGEEAKTIIAGYHWFTDWGRDTMISLEGLTLATGRYSEARHILRTFANYICDGLIPNMFPEHNKTGLYHTADATVWFFHALDRYLHFTDDRETLHDILPKLISIIDHHISGTRFNIGIDPNDGLLRQGEEGYQLTWMDAKVGDWVVTPRRGKTVEINALWYNALCLMEKWLHAEKHHEHAIKIRADAERTKKSFNKRFWNENTGFLYDVIDGPGGSDDSFRPNQIFSISLPNPVLDIDRWPSVVNKVSDQLLTPFGLRSLSPQHGDYKKNYDGDLYTRDAAYHQGTVWAWLIGPYIDAFIKTYPENRNEINKILTGFYQHMSESGIGSISEIFDAEKPYTPRGCIAQAWSVAEVLRCLAQYQTPK